MYIITPKKKWFKKTLLVSSGVGVISEFYTIGIFLSEIESLLLGVIVLAARLAHTVVSSIFLRHLLTDKETEQAKWMDISALHKHRYAYKILLFLTVLEISFLVYFPWLKSPFSEKYEGYHNLYQLKSVTYTQLGQAIVGTVAPSVWLAYSANHADKWKVILHFILTKNFPFYSYISSLSTPK